MGVMISMPVRTEKLRQLQELVMQTNGRFSRDQVFDEQTLSMPTAHVTFSFEEMDDYHKFNSAWQQIYELKVVEKQTPKWKRIMRRVLSIFKA